MPARLVALHRYIGHADRRAEPAHARRPRFAQAARWFHHRVVNFLELHPWPTHANERDKRREHFVAALTDLVDARIAQHAFDWKIDKVSRTSMNLERVIDSI